MHTTATLTNDELATVLAPAGEVLMNDIWNALDGYPDGSLERVTAALADIRRLAGVFEQRIRA